MAIMMMTAATPMMMPRVESRVRLLLLSMAVIATRNRLRILISMRVYVWVLVVLWVGEGCKGFGGGEYVGVVCVLADLAVAEHDVAAGVLGYLGVVGDEDDGAAFGVESLEEDEHFEGGAGVEVASGFVGE